MFERFTREAREVVVGAQDVARRLSHRRIGTEHLLLSLLTNDDATARLLRERGVTVDSARAMIERYVGGLDVGPEAGRQVAGAPRQVGVGGQHESHEAHASPSTHVDKRSLVNVC